MGERIALVTGAASGIGRASAEAFGEEGWDVVAVDREAPDQPVGTRFERVDLAEPDQVAELLGSVEEREGRLDALINNAAVQICRPLEELSLADWDRTMAVNLRAPFWTLRCAVPLLAEGGGSVVNVGSVHAEHTSPGMAAYAASKAGVAALTRAAALELADRGIRVNAVAPGAVDTPMLRGGLAREHLDGSAEERLEQLRRRQVLGRIADPAEVAAAVLFLADDRRSSFVTGETLVVDGGASARLSTE